MNENYSETSGNVEEATRAGNSATKKESLAFKALKGFANAYVDVDQETKAVANSEDDSSSTISGIVLRLTLFLFKIPVVSDALVAAAPKIKALVDKIPAKAFHKKIWEYFDKHPESCRGTKMIYLTYGVVVLFFGAALLTVIAMIMFGLSGLFGTFAGEETALDEAESSMKWTHVLFVATYVFSFAYALFVSYVSLAVVRIRKFANGNLDDVKDVVLSTFAIIINLVFIVFMTVAVHMLVMKGHS